jgi:hypothetical protein
MTRTKTRTRTNREGAKAPTLLTTNEGEKMIFYNGFNLLVDILLALAVYVIAHGIGFRRGLAKNK